MAICRRWGGASTRAAGKNYDDDDKYHQEQGLLVNNDDNDKYHQAQGLPVNNDDNDDKYHQEHGLLVRLCFAISLCALNDEVDNTF